MIAANSLSSTPVQLAWRGQATGRLLLNLCETAAATVFFLSSPLTNMAAFLLSLIIEDRPGRTQPPIPALCPTAAHSIPIAPAPCGRLSPIRF